MAEWLNWLTTCYKEQVNLNLSWEQGTPGISCHIPPPTSHKPDHVQELCSYNDHGIRLTLEEDDVATCAAGQEEARLDPSSLESQWDRNQLNSIVVTKPRACQGKEATETATTTLLDLTANQTLTVLLSSIQVPRFSGLSNSNAIHSTNIYRRLPICQILSKTLDLPG